MEPRARRTTPGHCPGHDGTPTTKVPTEGVATQTSSGTDVPPWTNRGSSTTSTFVDRQPPTKRHPRLTGATRSVPGPDPSSTTPTRPSRDPEGDDPPLGPWGTPLGGRGSRTVGTQPPTPRRAGASNRRDLPGPPNVGVRFGRVGGEVERTPPTTYWDLPSALSEVPLRSPLGCRDS